VASIDNNMSAGSRPALATTYEGDSPALLERIADLVDYIEITPDTIAKADSGGACLRPEILDEYQSVSSRIKFIAHGVGLSIGSYDRWNEDYFRLLDPLFERFDLEWHSEHLASTTVNGESLGTMLALPRTDEALDLVCARVEDLQRRYRVPFLLEHVIRLLPEPDADHSDASFLNAITSRTGCGLILDCYNLECGRHNFGFDIGEFLAELNLAPVRELHVAGGTLLKGFQLDVHSRPTADSTLALAIDVAERTPNLRAITYEFLKESIPMLSHDGICAELERIRRALRQ
jgi:uncharacterized protein (UPF0276 family)